MKIYKNPYVSYDSYFVKTGKAHTRKMEATASKGYNIHNMNGKWEVNRVTYYDHHLEADHPVVAENRVSIDRVIEKTVLNTVLDLINNKEQTAEATTPLEGKWILEKDLTGKPCCFHCSVCDEDFRYIDIKTKYPYCPYCGAKMKEE